MPAIGRVIVTVRVYPRKLGDMFDPGARHPSQRNRPTIRHNNLTPTPNLLYLVKGGFRIQIALDRLSPPWDETLSVGRVAGQRSLHITISQGSPTPWRDRKG